MSPIMPNLIIAGTVKGGTTSIFSYLSKHPDVCVSKVKETCFFLPVRYGQSRPSMAKYAKFFDHCGSNKHYILESTPGYLDGGERVALEIKATLGSPRIIFVLRNPTDRFVSFFRYQKAQMNLAKEMEFDEYIQRCHEMLFEKRRMQENDSYWGVDGGRYINYLPSWFEVFGKENIRVVFFDELVVNPGDVMCSLAKWLNIDPTPFVERGYDVENRTVLYRFGWVHRLAIEFNKMFEPFLRKLPLLKRFVRACYYMVNSGTYDKSVTDEQKKSVDNFYIEDNEALADFLILQGYKKMPMWLKINNEEA